MKKSILLIFIIAGVVFAQNISEAKKQKEIYPMADKILHSKCSSFDSKQIKTKEDVSNYINTQCKKMSKEQADILGIYLWDMKEGLISNHGKKKMKVGKDEKCPICGMLVHKYPRWMTQTFYKNGKQTYHYSFDGPKDMFIYILFPRFHQKKDEVLKRVYVTDYYTQETINGKKAYYVLESNIFGPMGKELIPFKNKKEAKTFLKDHLGKKILTFDEIDKKQLCTISRRLCKQ